MDHSQVRFSSSDSLPFWEGLLEKKILIQQCAKCHKLRHYPRPICDKCYSGECCWVRSKGLGTIHSWVISHHPFHPAFKEDVPYITVTVDLIEGVRMQAPLKNLERETELSIGRNVEVRFNELSPTLCLPYFEII